MNYYVSDEVPTSWDHIISAFVTMVEYDVEFNKGVPIDNTEFRVKRGLLGITYNGGDKITDAFAMFAREMSAGICTECALPSTRVIFGSPKCDNCY
jgi:hypothetical protein